MKSVTKVPESNEKEKSIEDKLEEQIESLIDNVQEGEFEEFLEILEKASQIQGSYSLKNILLIKYQMPNARVVNGYNQWQDQGRQVKKGEDGIKILAPKLYKVCPECDNTKKYHNKNDCDDNTDYKKWDKKCFGFKPVVVFDISQTKEIEGEDSFKLPELGVKGDGEDVFNRLESFALELVQDVKIREDLTVNGKYNIANKEIHLKKRDKASMSGTLVHELAHYYLHEMEQEYKQNREEMFVESVSYAVCEMLGLDSTDSKKYIKSWESQEKDFEVLRDDIENIVNISNKIIKEIRKI